MMQSFTEPFIIHIGMPKCGSTALQRFLNANEIQLRAHGYCYPKPVDGVSNHRVIALWLLDQYMPLKSGPRSASLAQMDNCESADLLAPLGQLHRNQDGRINILSSEGLSNISPRFLSSYFLPENTKIVLYIREQLDFLRSAYAQAVHGRKETRDFEGFVDWPWKLDYAEMIDDWVSVYGKRNVIPRVYDRNHLKGGDIIEDFMGILNVPDLSEFLFPPASKSNPSIGGPLLKFKLVLNRVSDWSEKRLLQSAYKGLGVLAHDNRRFRVKPVVSSRLAKKLRARYESSNMVLFQEYFPGITGFSMKPVDDSLRGEMLSADDFEYICGFLKEFPSKDPHRDSDNVIDAHYEKMKTLLQM